MERWVEHFEELLRFNKEDKTQENSKTECSAQEEEVEPPTSKEIVTSQRNGKAPGEDQIVAEPMKCAGKDIHEELHGLVTEIWRTEAIPDEWKNKLICPIF